jgi:hypothetical protein
MKNKVLLLVIYTENKPGTDYVGKPNAIPAIKIVLTNIIVGKKCLRNPEVSAQNPTVSRNTVCQALLLGSDFEAYRSCS